MIVLYTDVFEHFAVPQLKHLATGEIFGIGEVVENDERGFWIESRECVPGRQSLVADELFTWEYDLFGRQSNEGPQGGTADIGMTC